MNVLPYIVTTASIIGTVANSLQKRWCFWVWICTNTFWCIYNVANGSYAQALLHAFNFAMAILGLVKWGKKQRKAKEFEAIKDEFVEKALPGAPEWQKRYLKAWLDCYREKERK